MHDSRKTLLNVLIDNIFNIFNLAIVVLFVIFIANKDYLYLIPLIISLGVSIFQFVLDIKQYLIYEKHNHVVHVVINGQEIEKDSSELKPGDLVNLYQGDSVDFSGRIKSGIIFVDERLINGTTALIKKEVGNSVIKDSNVVIGNAVVEVLEIESKYSRKSHTKMTSINKITKTINIVLSLLVLIALLISFIFDRTKGINSLGNVSKASVMVLPILVNAIFVIFNYIKNRNPHEGILFNENTFFKALKDVDVVCLDKTNTITTGEFKIFKTSIISQSSFSSISLDVNRGFEQTVSNIIRANKESSGYFSLLQNHFVYEVSKIVEETSPLARNGLYSAITVKGGKTYAIGEPENFDLSNKESAYDSIEEYRSLGYRVLLLVESKNPLKAGLIDGKSLGTAIIVLEETIRENAIDLIKYLLKQNKIVKVISGDKLSITSGIVRKAGLDNEDHAISLKGIPFERIEMMCEETVVFSDALASQKAFIIQCLQNNGHKVLYIGDGDNDTVALKTADAGIALDVSSECAKKCAHAVVDHDFKRFESMKSIAKGRTGKHNHVLSILYSQNVFAAFYLFVFLIAKIINPIINNPFEFNHLFMMIIFGSIIPSILILMEPGHDNYQVKSFLRNFVADSLLYIGVVGFIYIFQLLQYNNVGFFAIPSDTTDMHEKLITSMAANNLSYLALLITSLLIFNSHMQVFNKYRAYGYVFTVFIPLAYVVLLAFNVDSLGVVTQIDTTKLGIGNYMMMLIIVVGCAGIYFFVLNIIETIKGETINVKSKSRS